MCYVLYRLRPLNCLWKLVSMCPPSTTETSYDISSDNWSLPNFISTSVNCHDNAELLTTTRNLQSAGTTTRTSVMRTTPQLNTFAWSINLQNEYCIFDHFVAWCNTDKIELTHDDIRVLHISSSAFRLQSPSILFRLIRTIIVVSWRPLCQIARASDASEELLQSTRSESYLRTCHEDTWELVCVL